MIFMASPQLSKSRLEFDIEGRVNLRVTEDGDDQTGRRSCRIAENRKFDTRGEFLLPPTANPLKWLNALMPSVPNLNYS